MPERPSANQLIQFGKETTPGTGVAASKLLQSIDVMTVSPDVASNAASTPVGQKFPVASIPGLDVTGATFNGDMNYGEMEYFLAALMKSVAPTGPGAQGEYTWTFLIDRTTQETPQTYSIEHGSAERADKFYYGLLTDFSMGSNFEASPFDGKFMGRSIQDGATLTAAPTSPEFVPIAPANWKLYMDATAGGIGGTQLTRAFNWKLGFTGRWGTANAVDGTTTFAAHVEKVPGIGLDLTLESDAVGMGLLTDVRAGSKKFIRLEATGPTIGAAVKYKLTIDGCYVIDTGPGDYGDEQDVVANTWHLVPAYDATLTKAISAVLINKVSAL